MKGDQTLRSPEIGKGKAFCHLEPKFMHEEGSFLTESDKKKKIVWGGSLLPLATGSGDGDGCGNIKGRKKNPITHQGIQKRAYQKKNHDVQKGDKKSQRGEREKKPARATKKIENPKGPGRGGKKGGKGGGGRCKPFGKKGP